MDTKIKYGCILQYLHLFWTAFRTTKNIAILFWLAEEAQRGNETLGHSKTFEWYKHYKEGCTLWYGKSCLLKVMFLLYCKWDEFQTRIYFTQCSITECTQTDQICFLNVTHFSSFLLALTFCCVLLWKTSLINTLTWVLVNIYFMTN